MTDLDHRVLEYPPRSRDARPPSGRYDRRSRSGRRLLGLGALLLLLSGLAVGVWRHYAQHLEVTAAAEQHRDFVPIVRVEAVRASANTMSVTLPATTNAFEAANIYARASGYITQRNVDIGSHVKAGDLLAAITAPELDHQIAQAEASLAQAKASRRQTKANRELARVTWGRDAVLVKQGWATQQQGDTDRLNYAAQQQAKQVNDAGIQSQEAQLLVLRQQKAYQQVVAPFDGIVTQRNIDVGSLVQADATSGTFMFALTQSDVMRIRLYVPQDAAIGVKPGVDAVVRVPEIPDRSFPGKVARIANALDPATRTLMSEIDVPNADGELSPGTYCTVELKIPRRTPSLIVPAGAIVFDRDGLHVLVVENGVVHSRKITEIRDLGTEVELSDGVKQGRSRGAHPTRRSRGRQQSTGSRSGCGQSHALTAGGSRRCQTSRLKGSINMRAVQLISFGNPDDGLEYVDIPEPDAPGPNQVLIGVEFSPINPNDLMVAQGIYAFRPPLPAVIGNEGVGRVLAVGPGVKSVKIGDRVLAPPSSFTWRERMVIPAGGISVLPPEADPQQLAMLAINPPTAALLLSEYVDLKQGDWVAQNAANSGVGRWVIAFAKTRGLKTVNIVRRPELVAELEAIGGDVVVADSPDVADRIKAAVGQAELRLALDGVSGPATGVLAATLSPRGTLVSFAAMSEGPMSLNPLDVIFKPLTMRGFWLGHPEIAAKIAPAIVQAAAMIASGQVHIPVAGTYPLSSIKEAIAHAQRGGKILLDVAGSST